MPRKNEGPAVPAKKSARPKNDARSFLCAFAQDCQHINLLISQPAEAIRRGFCAAWPAVAVRVEPGRSAAGCKSRERGLVQPRGYVNKTLDALTSVGVLRRHCERDPIPAHTGDGSGRSDGDVSSYRSSPQGPRLSASARRSWASCGLRSGSELSYSLSKGRRKWNIPTDSVTPSARH
jgi:hypothetical protein